MDKNQLKIAFLQGYSTIVYLMSLANRQTDRPDEEDIQIGCDLANMYSVLSYEAIRDYAGEEEAASFSDAANKLLKQCMKEHPLS